MERLTPRSPELWAVLSVLLCVTVCVGALDAIPHVTDEVVYTLQARIFASGARTAAAADVPSMLSYPFWVTGPESRAAFPPGWPLLLASGEMLGLAWLVNPLLMGAAVWLTHAVGVPMVGKEAAERGAVFVAVSPALVLLGASRMSHTSTLVALLLAAWPVVSPGSLWRWTLGGLGVAYAVLARPFDALLVGGLLLVVASVQLLRVRAWGPLLVFAGPAVVAAAGVLIDNQLLQGDPFTFPADAFYAGWTPERPDCNRLGFGDDVGCVPVKGVFGHSVAGALSQAVDRAVLLERLFLGVPVLGTVALLSGLRRPVLLLPLALVAAGHLLYWSPGLAYGPRFWALGIPGLALALGSVPLGRLLRFTPVLAVGASAFGLARVWPELSDRYWCVDARMSAWVESLPEHSGALLVRGTGLRRTGWPALGVDQFACDPMLEFGDLLVFWDPTKPASWQPRHSLSSPDENQRYRQRYQPGQPAWLIQHDVAADERSVSQLP